MAFGKFQKFHADLPHLTFCEMCTVLKLAEPLFINAIEFDNDVIIAHTVVIYIKLLWQTTY